MMYVSHKRISRIWQDVGINSFYFCNLHIKARMSIVGLDWMLEYNQRYHFSQYKVFKQSWYCSSPTHQNTLFIYAGTYESVYYSLQMLMLYSNALQKYCPNIENIPSHAIMVGQMSIVVELPRLSRTYPPETWAISGNGSSR